jgi:hypothetical protein
MPLYLTFQPLTVNAKFSFSICLLVVFASTSLYSPAQLQTQSTLRQSPLEDDEQGSAPSSKNRIKPST